jgi:endonuclease YncB( thermonuclease family)
MRIRGVMRLWLVLILGASEWRLAEAAPIAQWFTFPDCRFMPEENRAADSFHVMTADQRQFIFRLYFVDAPETDRAIKDRLREQAVYFGVSEDEVLQAGAAAKKFTAEWLKQSFSVTTRWQNASARSRLPGYYARIDLGGRDLGEMLVSCGWARARGTVAILPDGTRAKDHMAKLQKLEAEAKRKRLGIWAKSKTGE